MFRFLIEETHFKARSFSIYVLSGKASLSMFAHTVVDQHCRLLRVHWYVSCWNCASKAL